MEITLTASARIVAKEFSAADYAPVKVKTVFERSKISLTKWLAALFLMTATKKGVSAHQVHRMLGISYKSTWFMMHRLREAMRSGGLEPLGGRGKVIEADETYFGRAEEMHVSPKRKGRAYTKRGHYMSNREPRSRPRDDRGIRAGSIRSAVMQIHSAKVRSWI
jgi:hypothetical protein